MNGNRLAIVYALAFIAGMLALALRLLGWIPAVIFSIAFAGGFALWLATTYRTPIDPGKIIVPYLLTVILFIVHVYEEYVTGFAAALTDITGFHILEKNFLTIAAFLAPVVWLTGAVMVLKRWPLGYYFVNAFYVGMTIAELSHFVFPFLEDGSFHYVSGMYTAALPLFPAGYGFAITLTEIKRIRAANASDGA